MITDPLAYIEPMRKAGADIITFHYEAVENPAEVLAKIRSTGAKAGISVKPKTPVEVLFPLLADIDMVLIMTVEPGFGGQGFMADMVAKIEVLRCKAPELDIEVDGGINAETAKIVREAGANILVAGTAVFGAEDYSRAVASIRGDKK